MKGIAFAIGLALSYWIWRSARPTVLRTGRRRLLCQRLMRWTLRRKVLFRLAIAFNNRRSY